MARLSSENLTLEISFRNIELGWIQYDVLFLYEGKNLVNPDTLKGGSEYWDDRVENAFRVNEVERDTLIPILESVLRTNQPDYWEPIEPDMILAIYPDWVFPFVEDIQKVKSKGENLQKEPDVDYFTVIALIDEYNFSRSRYYTGDGLALIISCDRAQLTQFLSDLRNEYAEFCDKYNLPPS